MFKKVSAYPGKRNRINQQNQNSRPQSSFPTNHGVQMPAPMPASVYQNNGISVAPPSSSSSSSSSSHYPGTATPPYVPSSTATPVVATAYVPGQGPSTAPVVATAYVPGSTGSTGSAPIATVSAYSASGNSPPPTAPAYNPAYNPSSLGNPNYKTDEASFWECARCTFPNLRTESTCKGCGDSIPPGLLRPAGPTTNPTTNPTSIPPANAPQSSAPPGQSSGYSYNASQLSQLSGQMNHMSVHGQSSKHKSSEGVMRVFVPNGMNPGQKLKVRSPDGKEVVMTIPPRGDWLSDTPDGAKPFFRMKFQSPSPHSSAHSSAHSHSAPTATYHAAPFSTKWNDFHPHATSVYSPPSLGMRSVPHTPHGTGGIPPNGRHKSLIIGINYSGTRAALKGCINDAKNMQQLLQRSGYPNDGSHMLLLTDERHRGSHYQPTASNILKSFQWFLRDVRKGDVLFFHFSGHGGQVPDTTGHESDGYNETIIPLDFQRSGQISDDVLWGSLVFALPEGVRLTALMDMCHSGTGLDLPYDYNVDTHQWKEDINPAHSAGDVVLFSGCEDSQTSADVQSGYQAGGAMTRAFLQAHQSNPMATYHAFLVAIKRELRKKRFSQRPQLTSSQRFDAHARIFSLGCLSKTGSGGGGGVPSVIEPNHNTQVGRQKRRHVRPGKAGSGGASNIFNMAAVGIGAALFADALFG